MNETLIRVEQLYRIGPTFVARMMGVAYTTYAAYRSGSRVLPLYHERQALLLLKQTARQRAQLIEELAHVPRKHH